MPKPGSGLDVVATIIFILALFAFISAILKGCAAAPLVEGVVQGAITGAQLYNSSRPGKPIKCVKESETLTRCYTVKNSHDR